MIKSLEHKQSLQTKQSHKTAWKQKTNVNDHIHTNTLNQTHKNTKSKISSANLKQLWSPSDIHSTLSLQVQPPLPFRLFCWRFCCSSSCWWCSSNRGCSGGWWRQGNGGQGGFHGGLDGGGGSGRLSAGHRDGRSGVVCPVNRQMMVSWVMSCLVGVSFSLSDKWGSVK